MATQYLLIFIIVLGVIRYLLFKWKRKHFEEMVDRIPGPPAYPLIGNIHLGLGSSKELLKNGRLIVERYGSPCKFWIVHKAFVLVFDSQNFQTVAQKALDKGDGYQFIRDLLGEGLITANGPKWRQNRRILNPAFNVTLMTSYFLNKFNELSELLVGRLAGIKNGEEIDLWPYVFQSIRDTICVTAMGYHNEYANEEEKKKRVEEYSRTLNKVSTIVTERIWKPWLHFNPLFRLYNLITGDYKLFRHVYSLPSQIIRNKKEELKRPRNSEKLQGKNIRNFIDILLNSEVFKDSQEQELVNEVITFMVAGSETTTITLCFTILMLAMNPKMQERVYEELHGVFGDRFRAAEISDLSRLDLMELCIKETLRRFPPVPFILREAKEDIELNNGLILPTGVTIVLNILTLHTNENNYKDPMKWNPDRFLNEDMAQASNFAPFSIGPRSCIGAKYAMLVMKAQLSLLLRKFQFTTEMKMNDLHLSFDTMLRNNSGFRVRLKQRNVEQ